MTRVDLKMNRLLLRTFGIAFGVLLCCLSPMKGPDNPIFLGTRPKFGRTTKPPFKDLSACGAWT